MFSGLNLAFFNLNCLSLEIEATESPNGGAINILKVHQDSNFILMTILWGTGIKLIITRADIFG